MTARKTTRKPASSGTTKKKATTAKSKASATPKKAPATPKKKAAAAPKKKAAAAPKKKAASATPEKKSTTAAKKPGKFSSRDVNLGHVFALRPRVTTSFPQEKFRSARDFLADEIYETIEAAARAVVEKALETSRTGAGASSVRRGFRGR